LYSKKDIIVENTITYYQIIFPLWHNHIFIRNKRYYQNLDNTYKIMILYASKYHYNSILYNVMFATYI